MENLHRGRLRYMVSQFHNGYAYESSESGFKEMNEFSVRGLDGRSAGVNFVGEDATIGHRGEGEKTGNKSIPRQRQRTLAPPDSKTPLLSVHTEAHFRFCNRLKIVDDTRRDKRARGPRKTQRKRITLSSIEMIFVQVYIIVRPVSPLPAI